MLHDPAPLLEHAVAVGNAGDKPMAVYLGTSMRQIQRWKNGGSFMTLKVLDEICSRIGHHPTHFWPNYGEHSPDCELYQEAG